MTAAPRYEWPAQAMMPHAQRRGQAPLDPTPLTAPEAAGNAPVAVAVADGYWRDYRWWVTRTADIVHPVVHIQGWDGPRHVSLSREMEGVCLKRVRAWIDQTIENVAAAAKKRAKGGR